MLLVPFTTIDYLFLLCNYRFEATYISTCGRSTQLDVIKGYIIFCEHYYELGKCQQFNNELYLTGTCCLSQSVHSVEDIAIRS